MLRCAVFGAVVALLVACFPLLIAYHSGGWVRLYTHNPHNFSFAAIPDMSRRVVVVTGANTGIGKVSARELARKGAHVILTARSAAKGQQAVADSLEEVGADKRVEFLPLDLASFRSIRSFAKQFLAKGLPLHILLLNAGVMMCPYSETEDGFELQIGTNHVGHHLLVRLLEDKLVASAPSRVVVVSSIAHQNPYEPEGIRVRQFRTDEDYHPWKAYGQSKLANALMSAALARRLEGKRVFVNALHPGAVESDLMRHVHQHLQEMQFGGVLRVLVDAVYYAMVFSTDDGALTQLFLATHPSIETEGISGQYFEPVAYRATPSAHALNVTLQEELWEATERLTRVARQDL
eukprot:EG_transcript_14652